MFSKKLAKTIKPNLFSRKSADGRWEIIDGVRVIAVSHESSSAWSAAYHKVRCPLRDGQVVREVLTGEIYKIEDQGTHFLGVSSSGKTATILPVQYVGYAVIDDVAVVD